MKKLFAFSLCLVVGLSFAFQKSSTRTRTTNTPSVKTTISNETTSDTSDLDVQMKRYEAEMRELEKKMKPFELQMTEKEKEMKPLERLMKEKERELKSSGFDKKISEEMGRIGEQMGKIGEEMSKIGDKMSLVGDEMGKIGDKMGIIGEEMGKRHKKVFSWFFQELKNDGLIQLNTNISVFMEANVLVVNGKTLDATQLAKYKKGLETKIGKPLKSDFSIYFKGSIENLTEEGFETNGNMNTHF